jgi:opacity protein-like surface antigen
MGIQKILSVAALASVTLLGGAYGHADDSKYYVGVEFGTSDHDTNAVITSGSGSLTDSDSGSKLVFGYKFTPSIALELQYANLGEASLSFTDGSTVEVSGVSASIGPGEGGTATTDISSVGVSGIYRFNAEGASRPYVKLGLHSWDVEGASTSTVVTGGNSSGTDIFYGVGAEFDVANSLALNISYDVYDIDNSQESTTEVSTLGVGLNYRF